MKIKITHILFVFTALIPLLAFAQDGSPDTSFGINGVVEMELPGTFAATKGFIQLTNNNLFLSCHYYGENSQRISFLTQFDENGNLIESYGVNGLQNLVNQELSISSILYQIDDENLIVTAKDIINDTNSLSFYKLSLDGVINENYGLNGSLTPFPLPSRIGKAKFNSDGSFTLAGIENNNETNLLTVKKYSSNGVLTDMFSQNINNEINGELKSVSSLFISDNGALSIAFKTINNSTQFNYILQLNMDGTLDTTFGNNGVASIPYQTEYNCSHLENNLGEKIVSCSSYINEDIPTHTRIIKLNIDGSINTSFNNNGVIEIPFYSGNIKIQPNQRLLFIGTASDFEGGLDVTMHRYFSSGHIDPSFNYVDNYSKLGSINPIFQNNESITLGASSIWYNEPNRIVLLSYNNRLLNTEDTAFENFKIFPNPSNGTYTIELPQSISTSLPYLIYDNLGRLIDQGMFNELTKTIDLTQVSTGIYFLKMNTTTFKLIKNKN